MSDDKPPRKSHFFTVSPPAGPLTKLPANYPPQMPRITDELAALRTLLAAAPARARTEDTSQPRPTAINVKLLPPDERAKVLKELVALFEGLKGLNEKPRTRKVAKGLVVAAMAEKGFISIPWQLLEDACVKAKFLGKIGRPEAKK